ncbi:MAG: ABC transporter substrate-binding protein, partial [Candidatus Omnitrophota bacterium]
EVYSRLDEIDEPKPKVYVELGMKGPSEYSNTYGDYMWGALIEKSGGINIAKGKIERWGPISPEYLLDANPDVIIITGSYWPGCPGSMRLGYYANPEESRELLKAFTERPGWDTLSAVNNNRVYSIHHGLARDIWDFVAIQYMAKCFYPDVFEDLNPEENFKEFHEKFLPVDYSGVWMLSLEE